MKAFCIGSNNLLNVSYDNEGDVIIEAPDKNVDRITCIAASKHSLIIGRESGIIYQFTLPDCYTVRTLMLESKVGAQKIAINCNNTYEFGLIYSCNDARFLAELPSSI